MEKWPRGCMFQCTGCRIWCHTQCLYSREKAPVQAFCDKCHETLRALSDSHSNAPLRAGKLIKQKSRVLVCRTAAGLAEVRL